MNNMDKEVRLVQMNDVWLDIDQVLKLLKKCIDVAYDKRVINTKEYLIMYDFKEDMISRFGDEEEDDENCD